MYQLKETNGVVILGDPACGSRQDNTGYGELALRATPDSRNELSEFPGIRREVERISEIMGGDCSVVLGTQASRNAIFTLPSALRLLHIAAHVEWRPNDRRRSFIRLAPSGAEDEMSGLRVDEIRKLSLSTEMVVLSGCNTARPWPDEEAESISRAFLFAGASSVVGSLWGVDDGTTAHFMESFYRHLLLGESRGSALREAKLEMIRAGRSDPFYWGAFVLIGNRGTIELPSKVAKPKPLMLFILLAVTSLFLTGVLLRVRFLRSRS